MKRKMAIAAVLLMPLIGFTQQYQRTKKNTGFRIEAGIFDVGKKNRSGFNLENGQYYGLGFYRKFERLHTQLGLNYVIQNFSPVSDSIDQVTMFKDVTHSLQVPVLMDFDLFSFGIGHSRYYECTYFSFSTLFGPDMSYTFSGVQSAGQPKVALNGNIGLGMHISKSGASRRNASWEGKGYLVYRRGLLPMVSFSGENYFTDYIGIMFTLTHFKTYKWSNM